MSFIRFIHNDSATSQTPHPILEPRRYSLAPSWCDDQSSGEGPGGAGDDPTRPLRPQFWAKFDEV